MVVPVSKFAVPVNRLISFLPRCADRSEVNVLGRRIYAQQVHVKAETQGPRPRYKSTVRAAARRPPLYPSTRTDAAPGPALTATLVVGATRSTVARGRSSTKMSARSRFVD